MDAAELAAQLHQQSDSKIVFVIADGLGGIVENQDGQWGTELEIANTPNLDRLAREGTVGLLTPVAPGITCGSGPGHFALFGYDPVEYKVGRGVLTALGVDFELEPGDVAARGNFCTVDEEGQILDRRAGRISSEQNGALLRELREIQLEGVELFVETVKEHRFLLVLRGEGLHARIQDTDPQETGVKPREPSAGDEGSRRTAEIVAQFVEQAGQRLQGKQPANMILLRGFARLPELTPISARYGLSACALAGYPMYRGIARLLGMDTIECGPDLDSEIEALHAEWSRHNYFFLHYKQTDSSGEDGDFASKRQAIENLDQHLPSLLALSPDVLVITGDHSSPSRLRSHSWHPVPVLISASTARRDGVQTFGETACINGGLGQMLTKDLMPLALAHAGRLRKFGA